MKLNKQKINFTQVSNLALNSEVLTFKAKGLYAYLYSKPEGWNFSYKRIATDSKDGEKAVLSGLKELEEHGFLIRQKNANWTVDYELFWEKPGTENRHQEKKPEADLGYEPKGLLAEIGTISNKDTISNTIIDSKTKCFDKKSFEYLLAYKFLEAHKINRTPGVIYKLKNSTEETILQSFAGGLDKLKRLDEYKEKEIEFIINFVISDSKAEFPDKNFYWLDNIQAIAKLRKPNKEKIPFFVALIEPAKKAFITKKNLNIWTLEA